MYWRQNCQVPRCCLCGCVRRTRLAGNGERAREYPGKMDIDKRLFSHNLTASGLFTTDFHLHEAMFSTRAGNITCRVGSRSKTSNGQLRHRCADDALSSGQPLDDATALDQQETPDTNELLHINTLLRGVLQLLLVIRGISPAAWRSCGWRGVGETRKLEDDERCQIFAPYLETGFRLSHHGRLRTCL